MDDNITKIIKEKFDALPPSIQEIILSTNYQETLIEIGKKYQLNVEQMGILERETTLVMMGLTPTKDFETELTRELKIDAMKGSQIVKEINEKIFLRIRELLKLMNTPAGEEPSVDEDEIPLPNLPRNSEEERRGSDISESKSDTQIMNSAGIEIIKKEPLLEISEATALPDREEMLKKIENPEPVTPLELSGAGEKTQPILAQKLSGSVQIPTVKTEHTLDNLTKTSNLAVGASNDKKIPNIDPYREIPE